MKQIPIHLATIDQIRSFITDHLHAPAPLQPDRITLLEALKRVHKDDIILANDSQSPDLVRKTARSASVDEIAWFLNVFCGMSDVSITNGKGWLIAQVEQQYGVGDVLVPPTLPLQRNHEPHVYQSRWLSLRNAMRHTTSTCQTDRQQIEKSLSTTAAGRRLLIALERITKALADDAMKDCETDLRALDRTHA